jgi:hypothetical protein
MKFRQTYSSLTTREQVRNREVKISRNKKVVGQQKREKLTEMPRKVKDEQAIFISGMESRGFIPIENCGDGNCVFISLAEIVMGDSAKFDFMR